MAPEDPPAQDQPEDSQSDGGSDTLPVARTSFPVVGMGASAGGLEAFQKFFDHMPPDSGLAFVLVQHLDPRHETLMAELVARHTKMPVEMARDRTRVTPNHIYVIPPNAALTIEGGELRVGPLRHKFGPQTLIDRFLRSLAEECREQAVCILLSGSGSDGTLGVRAVKEHGGMAMAQAAESAKHDSIPRSGIATGLVDYVLPAEELPARLVEYVTYLREKRGLDAMREEAADHLARICLLLRRKTGHDFTQYKQGTIVRRIQRRMQLLQSPSVTAYVDRLRKDPAELEQLFKELLIGVTHFFRDPKAFEVLEKDVIPRIIADAEDSIRVWTPGCATGEEAYSVAILLREALGKRDDLRIQVFAGDIDEEGLETARQAVYPEGIANQVTPERLERFFSRKNSSYALAKDIRQMCIFSTHNVIKDPPFSRLDLIVCRNLLIYLAMPMQRHVIQLFHYALKPQGYLFLGSSEHVVGSPELFRTVHKSYRIYQRVETITRPQIAFPVTPPHPPRPPGGHVAPPASPRAAKEAPGSVQVLERLLIQHYSPAWVVINSQGDAVYFSPRTGRYLEPPAGSPSNSLVDMARKDIRLELRTAIHRALQSGETVVREDLLVETHGETQRINLIVRPVRELGTESGLFMVVFQELGATRSSRTALADSDSDAADSAVQQLEHELRTTKEHLQATVEELETSNEELTSSNEELLSTNEELQSSNEELQTGKEEMQSVNEELETINVELAKKIEQLDTAHVDLQNLFDSTRIASIFLDRNLHIEKFTPDATEVFRLIDSDVGRSIADITPRFAGHDLLEAIRTVLRSLITQERQVELVDGSATYMVRILPYRGVSDVIRGVVLTFVDITALTRSQSRQAELAAIVESTVDAIVAHTFDGIITIWNAGATRMFGYTAAEAIGQPIGLIVPPDNVAESSNALERVRKGEVVEPFETVRVTREGKRIPVSLTVSAVRSAAGTPTGIAASFRPLGETHRARDVLQSEVRQRDEFMAMLSHELRGPLSPLRICLEILQSPGASEKQIEKAKAMMERQFVHLTNLVDELLDASRMSSGKISLNLRMVDLVQLVSTTAEDHRNFIEGQGLALDVSLPSAPVWVNGDPTRLTQAVGNLLHNAGKFTNVGSVWVQVRVDKGGEWAAVKIRDSGVGISPEMLADVFLPYSQAEHTLDRSKGGLGLGLALTRALITSHNGTVEARSKGIGHGSEFELRLPVMKGANAPSESEGEGPAVLSGGPWRILIVEDNPDTAQSLQSVLELAGYVVSTASDGKTALKLAQKVKPHVVVCDIGLPQGMDGYAVAQAFRADRKLGGIRLVALTGYGREQDQARAGAAGFDAHLRKPPDLAALKRTVAQLVRGDGDQAGEETGLDER